MAAKQVKFNNGIRRIFARSKRKTALQFRRANMRAQLRELEDNFNFIMDELKRATVPAVEYALLPIFERSQELVPVEFGSLKESGFLEASRVGHITQGEVGYAKNNWPPYAVFVHEMLELKHASPTQAKYLARAINEKAGEAPARLTEWMEFPSG